MMKYLIRYSFFYAIVVLPTVGFTDFSAQAEAKVIIKKIEASAMDDMIEAKDNRIVVAFMAAWCGPCIQELPDLNKLHKKYKNKGLNLIGVSIDPKGPEAMQPIVDQLRINFPVYWYGEKAVIKYNLNAIPMLLFVKQGRIVERLRGKPSSAFLEKKIREFLK
ncbi:MAG: TlpA family protein disulfide reductase [Desulfobacterales bacterium]|nr:MAG: TlpA family protein disulfide reductase [Desulfobacterales bacterium]